MNARINDMPSMTLEAVASHRYLPLSYTSLALTHTHKHASHTHTHTLTSCVDV